MQSLYKTDRTDTPLDKNVLITAPLDSSYSTYFFLNLNTPLLAGDTIFITADGEVEIPVSYNTEVCSQVILAGQWNSNATALDTGNSEIGHIIGSDVSNNPIHYNLPVRSIVYQVQAGIATPTIQYRIRCRSTAAPGTDYAVLKPTQGHLGYMLFR